MQWDCITIKRYLVNAIKHVRTRRFELPRPKTVTGPSSQRVYQFRHVRFYKSKGIKMLGIA